MKLFQKGGWNPKANPACSKCPLRFEGICVQSEGNVQAKLAVVGMHPGYKEEQLRRPFVGPSGRLFDRILREAGIDRKDLFVGNVGNCKPKEIQVAPDVWLTKKEAEERIVKNCKTRFYQELHHVHPRVIVAFGGLPLEVLTGKRSITKRHGALHIVDLDRILAMHEGMDVGNWVFREDRMTYVLPVFHPAYLLRGKPQFHPILVQKFKRAKAIAAGEQPALFREILVAPHVRDVDMVLDLAEAHTDRWLAENRPLGVDVEATMEGGSRKAAFTVFGYSSEHYRTGIAISILEWCEDSQSYKFTWNREQWVRVRRLIEKVMLSQNSKCYHNFGYDVTLLRRFFDHLGGLQDTIVYHSLFQPDIPHGLDFVCQSELDVPAWKRDFRQAEKKGTANNLDLLHYNAQDHMYGGMIKTPLINKVHRRGNIHLVEHTMRMCELARRAHLNGIPLDMEKLKEVRATQIERRAEALLDLQMIIERTDGGVDALNASVKAERVNPDNHKILSALPVLNDDGNVLNKKGYDLRGFNPRSAAQARWFLYEHLGLQPLYYTAGGAEKDPTKQKPSHATKAIVDYLSHPSVKRYVEYFEANADIMTLKPAISPRYYDPVTGCTHPSWNPTSMKGTRWTSQFNAQNWAKGMRKVFVAPDGRVWVGADLSQIEYRIASVFAGIPPLLDLFNAPAFDEFAEPWKKLDGRYDAHSMVAAEVFGLAFTQETDEKKKGGLRTLVKRVVYALFYGAMPRKIYDSLRRDRRLSTGIRALLTLERIEEIHEGFRKRFPEWDGWADEEYCNVRNHGVQIFPPFDRRRGWRLSDMEGMLEPTKLRNTPIQLAAGDVVNRMFWKIEEEIYKRNLDALFSIHLHDAGYWNTAEEDAEEVRDLVNEHFSIYLTGYKGHKVHIYGQASIGKTAADVG
jgi:uracil-DNA glycosylase family 4